MIKVKREDKKAEPSSMGDEFVLTPVPLRKEAKIEREEKDTKVVLFSSSIPRGLTVPKLRLKQYQGFAVTVNSAAAKYLQFLAGATTFGMSAVATASEFSSISALYDEMFLHSARFHFHPNNKYSAQSTASSSATGSPGDLNTCPATIYGMQHNQTNYSDASTTYILAKAAQQSKWVNLGDSFTFTWKNTEKFSWDGPLGDASSSSTTQGWLNQSSVATRLGGYVSLATPYASGASVGIGTLLENGSFGVMMVEFIVSWRVRS